MNDAALLELSTDRHIAYHNLPAKGHSASLPGLIFLGGFKSAMSGVKATWLQAWAERRGRAFLRFDYRGHGQSSGRFEDGCIGDWADDAEAVLQRLTDGPQILIGSSMGGWIALLLARRHPKRVAGIIGIAAAPDFTDRIEERMTKAKWQSMLAEGQVSVPSRYSPEPYIYTRRLVEDGRRHRVLAEPLHLACPLHLLHGTDDVDVDPSVALALLGHAEGPDTRLTLLRGGDHRLSDTRALTALSQMIDAMDQAVSQGA